MHLYEERATKVEEQGLEAALNAIRLYPNDDVVIARHHVLEGTPVPEEGSMLTGLIPAGHKVATRRVAAGQPVQHYNQIIGIAKQSIEPGQHVHTHDLAMAEFARDYAFCVDAKPTEYVAEPASVMGFFVRSDGRVATRNYVGILCSVTCPPRRHVSSTWAVEWRRQRCRRRR